MHRGWGDDLKPAGILNPIADGVLLQCPSGQGEDEQAVPGSQPQAACHSFAILVYKSENLGSPNIQPS